MKYTWPGTAEKIVLERRNRPLKDMTRSMLHNSSYLTIWEEKKKIFGIMEV